MREPWHLNKNGTVFYDPVFIIRSVYEKKKYPADFSL